MYSLTKANKSAIPLSRFFFGIPVGSQRNITENTSYIEHAEAQAQLVIVGLF